MSELITGEFLGTAAWQWYVFIAAIIALLAFDLGVLHREHREIGIRESLLLSAGYITAGALFGLWVWYEKGAASGVDFYTGFLVEKSLSLDNVFLMALIFQFLAIPRKYQHEVLFWGILGVIVLRAILIGVGAALISNFEWILYVFGAFIVYTGLKMLFSKSHDQVDLEKSRVVRFLRGRMRITKELHGDHFFVRQADEQGREARWATPLFLALVMIECMDLMFAVDSVPAIYSITQDPYIVYTSNIFAILGMRALYFALAALIHRFAYLKYALAAVLVFIGCKIFVVNIFGKIPPAISLSVTLGLLLGGILFSLWKTRGQPGQTHDDADRHPER